MSLTNETLSLTASGPARDPSCPSPGAKTELTPQLPAATGSDPGQYGRRAAALRTVAGEFPIRYRSASSQRVEIGCAADTFTLHSQKTRARSSERLSREVSFFVVGP